MTKSIRLGRSRTGYPSRAWAYSRKQTKGLPIQEQDVAVLDLRMPGADGTEVFETLKQNHKFIENIMLTVYVTLDLAAEWITSTHLNTWKSSAMLQSIGLRKININDDMQKNRSVRYE
ncbi:response regulator [Desulfosarcina sp.]|uniref:response regulator n=1 Tax=Desulfosarcina sp. TaxID=2027861 RepID=UPI0039B83651